MPGYIADAHPTWKLDRQAESDCLNCVLNYTPRRNNFTLTVAYIVYSKTVQSKQPRFSAQCGSNTIKSRGRTATQRRCHPLPLSLSSYANRACAEKGVGLPVAQPPCSTMRRAHQRAWSELVGKLARASLPKTTAPTKPAPNT